MCIIVVYFLNSRGMHDTPKLIAVVLPLLLLGGSIPLQSRNLVAAFTMAPGGFMIGNRVTNQYVTDSDHAKIVNGAYG